MRRPHLSRPATRYATITALLLGLAAPAGLVIRRAYGRDAARRFAAGMAGVLAVQQALVAFTLRRKPNPHGLGPVDLMTLSRGAASALLLGLIASGVRNRRGLAGRLGWCTVVYGAIVCDWLDGPLARRTHTSEAGAIFDLEGDSWLTPCTAAAAVTWGGLSRLALLSALLNCHEIFPSALLYKRRTLASERLPACISRQRPTSSLRPRCLHTNSRHR